VAYTLIFGALNGNYEVLIAPSILAFLASFSREIVKDLADKEGDEFAGLTTTAKLKPKIINLVIFIVAVLFLILSPLPILLKQVGLIYAIIVGISVVPLHIYWIHLYLKRDFTKSAKLLKYQMFLGLLALILDKLI
jgi:4-hydroxybenzoate polyprenyltransferase